MPKFTCNICNAVCAQESHLLSHKLKVHRTSHGCQQCELRFESGRALVLHWLKSGHRYYCTACKTGFTTTELLVDHVCLRRCHVCNMAASSHEDYVQHWKDVANDPRHEDENPFVAGTICRDASCTKDFKTRALLQAHLRQSNGCQHCHLHLQNDNNLRMVSASIAWVRETLRTQSKLIG